jgi:hypothetical protein
MKKLSSYLFLFFYFLLFPSIHAVNEHSTNPDDKALIPLIASQIKKSKNISHEGFLKNSLIKTESYL